MKKNRFFLIALCIVAVIAIVMVFRDANKPDVSQGIEILEEMEARDLSAVQEEIEAKRSAESSENVLFKDEIKDLNFKEIFSNSVVMGDSITEGISDYGFLNSSEVICKSGISMVSTDEHMAQAKALDPDYVFLSYGSNDISHDHYDYERFQSRFEELLDRAVETFPDSKIFVNSIFPATEPLTEKQPWYKNVDKFNEVMKKVCEEYGIPFLDNTDIVKEEYFSSDGYHFSAELYPYWLYNMAQGAGLLQ